MDLYKTRATIYYVLHVQGITDIHSNKDCYVVVVIVVVVGSNNVDNTRFDLVREDMGMVAVVVESMELEEHLMLVAVVEDNEDQDNMDMDKLVEPHRNRELAQT